jgi:hypothetical protein
VAEEGAEKKSAWDRYKAPVAFFSAVLLLIVGVVKAPGDIADALGRTADKNAKADLEQKRTALAEAGPRLDVSYLFLTEKLVGTFEFEQKSRRRVHAKEAITLLSFPSIRNEILDGLDKPRTKAVRACGLGRYPQTSVAFLVVRNRGKRDAGSVAVDTDRLQLSRSVRVRETPAVHDDYAGKLRESTTRTEGHTVQVPRTLGPGEGVRIPLFISAARYQHNDVWCFTSASVYQPRSLTFVDPVTGAKTTQPVRRMNDPLALDDGVVTRG